MWRSDVTIVFIYSPSPVIKGMATLLFKILLRKKIVEKIISDSSGCFVERAVNVMSSRG